MPNRLKVRGSTGIDSRPSRLLPRRRIGSSPSRSASTDRRSSTRAAKCVAAARMCVELRRCRDVEAAGSKYNPAKAVSRLMITRRIRGCRNVQGSSESRPEPHEAGAAFRSASWQPRPSARDQIRRIRPCRRGTISALPVEQAIGPANRGSPSPGGFVEETSGELSHLPFCTHPRQTPDRERRKCTQSRSGKPLSRRRDRRFGSNGWIGDGAGTCGCLHSCPRASAARRRTDHRGQSPCSRRVKRQQHFAGNGRPPQLHTPPVSACSSWTSPGRLVSIPVA